MFHYEKNLTENAPFSGILNLKTQKSEHFCYS